MWWFIQRTRFPVIITFIIWIADPQIDPYFIAVQRIYLTSHSKSPISLIPSLAHPTPLYFSVSLTQRLKLRSGYEQKFPRSVQSILWPSCHNFCPGIRRATYHPVLFIWVTDGPSHILHFLTEEHTLDKLEQMQENFFFWHLHHPLV